jgi:hypothetical protein
MMGCEAVDWIRENNGSIVDCSEHDNEPSDSIKGLQFLDSWGTSFQDGLPSMALLSSRSCDNV